MVVKNSKNVGQTMPQQVFELEIRSCYGTCQAYKVVIFESDSLLYEGFKYVVKQGRIIKKLPKGNIN